MGARIFYTSPLCRLVSTGTNPPRPGGFTLARGFVPVGFSEVKLGGNKKHTKFLKDVKEMIQMV